MEDDNNNENNIPSGNETIQIYLRIRPTNKKFDHLSKIFYYLRNKWGIEYARVLYGKEWIWGLH